MSSQATIMLRHRSGWNILAALAVITTATFLRRQRGVEISPAISPPAASRWPSSSSSVRSSFATERKRRPPPPLPLRHHRDIGFLHVGKTGGATLAKLIRRACLTKSSCAKRERNPPRNETEISRLVTRYYHMTSPTERQIEKHTSFLITVRNPLDRAASWYYFRHPANSDAMDVSKTTNDDKLRLFRCYPTWDELATIGLASQPSRWRYDRTCARLARGILSGTMEGTAADHMHWNYGFYLSKILARDEKEDKQDRSNDDNRKEEKELFVTRTERLWDDWQTINSMLGGGDIVKVESVSHRRKNATNVSSLRETTYDDRTVSPRGIVNLCCALRKDIGVFDQALKKAVNFNDDDVQESIGEVESKCGALDGLEDRCRDWDIGWKSFFLIK